MEKIIKYKTFDNKEFTSFEAARRHLVAMENGIMNQLSCALASGDISKIKDPESKGHLIKAIETNDFMFRRHYALYYLDENMHLFAELQRIKGDLNVNETDFDEV